MEGKKNYAQKFSLEGVGDLTAYVNLRHQGSSVVAILRLTLGLESETCEPPRLTLTLKVRRLGDVVGDVDPSNKKVPVGVLFDIVKSVENGQWIFYCGNKFNFEHKMTENIRGEATGSLYFRLNLNLHVDYVKKPSNPTKKLNDPSLNQFFTDSKIRDETSDFKIICEGEELKCHKLVLSLRSDFFKTMFNGDMKEAKQGFLNIEEFKLETMKSFHKYLYTDSIYQSEIDVDLLRAAHMYDFKRLVGECEYGLSLMITKENAKEDWWVHYLRDGQLKVHTIS